MRDDEQALTPSLTMAIKQGVLVEKTLKQLLHIYRLPINPKHTPDAVYDAMGGLMTSVRRPRLKSVLLTSL